MHSRSQNVGLSYLHIFSPNLTAEVGANYYRMFFYFLNASNFNGKDVVSQAGITGYDNISSLQPAGPNIALSGYATVGGSTDNRPKANRIRTYQYRSSLTWASGHHNMKFGAQLTHQSHAFLNGNADFLIGNPQTAQRSSPQNIFGVAGSSWSFYGQDDYRVSRNLTLNIGLRWELISWMAGVRGQTNAFDFATGKVIIPTRNGTPDLTAQPLIPTFWSVFRPLLETTEEKGLPWSIRPRDDLAPAPRIGFAWRAFGSDKWVVRSAYGIFWLYPDTNLLQPLYRTPPFNVIQLVNNDVPTAATLTPTRSLGNYWLGQPVASLNTTPAISTMGTFYRSAYQQTWNLNLQHEFKNGAAAEIAYVGNKGTRLQAGTAGNVPLPGPGNVQARRPYPQWGVFLLQQWGGSSTYHSFQAKVEKRFAKGFSFLGSYTFSKCLDGPGSEEGASPATYLDNLNRGPCNFDVPHNFVTSYILELPFGKGRKFFGGAPRAVNALIGGWQWQGINTLQSGVPYTVTINTDRANTGQGSQRPDSVAPTIQPKNLGCWYFTSANPACRALLPSQADTFALPAQFTYGNLGRNTLRGDRLVQLDMSLIKGFKITESKSFEFRAQVFNLTNTASFASPSGNENLATGGQVTATRNQPRLYEFGLKFSF